MKDDMEDHCSEPIKELTTREGNPLAVTLYKTRGHNLVEVVAAHQPMTSTIHMAPTHLERGQISSALQFAMQAERCAINIIIGGMIEQAEKDSVKKALEKLQKKLERRGSVLWPWAWDPKGDETKTELLEIAAGSKDAPEDDDDDTVETPATPTESPE